MSFTPWQELPGWIFGPQPSGAFWPETYKQEPAALVKPGEGMLTSFPEITGAPSINFVFAGGLHSPVSGIDMRQAILMGFPFGQYYGEFDPENNTPNAPPPHPFYLESEFSGTLTRQYHEEGEFGDFSGPLRYKIDHVHSGKASATAEWDASDFWAILEENEATVTRNVYRRNDNDDDWVFHYSETIGITDILTPPSGYTPPSQHDHWPEDPKPYRPFQYPNNPDFLREVESATKQHRYLGDFETTDNKATQELMVKITEPEARDLSKLDIPVDHPPIGVTGLSVGPHWRFAGGAFFLRNGVTQFRFIISGANSYFPFYEGRKFRLRYQWVTRPNDPNYVTAQGADEVKRNTKIELSEQINHSIDRFGEVKEGDPGWQEIGWVFHQMSSNNRIFSGEGLQYIIAVSGDNGPYVAKWTVETNIDGEEDQEHEETLALDSDGLWKTQKHGLYVGIEEDENAEWNFQRSTLEILDAQGNPYSGSSFPRQPGTIETVFPYTDTPGIFILHKKRHGHIGFPDFDETGARYKKRQTRTEVTVFNDDEDPGDPPAFWPFGEYDILMQRQAHFEETEEIIDGEVKIGVDASDVVNNETFPLREHLYDPEGVDLDQISPTLKEKEETGAVSGVKSGKWRSQTFDTCDERNFKLEGEAENIETVIEDIEVEEVDGNLYASSPIIYREFTDKGKTTSLENVTIWPLPGH